jgi:hypothetical protein
MSDLAEITRQYQAFLEGRRRLRTEFEGILSAEVLLASANVERSSKLTVRSTAIEQEIAYSEGIWLVLAVERSVFRSYSTLTLSR